MKEKKVCDTMMSNDKYATINIQYDTMMSNNKYATSKTLFDQLHNHMSDSSLLCLIRIQTGCRMNTSLHIYYMYT